MAAYTSNQAGAWGTAAVWTPNGVPGDGDTITILHAITDNADRTIGTGAGIAMNISVGGSLEHVTPGAPTTVTFTIKGNVLVIGDWLAGDSDTPYGSATDDLIISITGAFTFQLILAASKFLFYGNPAFNEADDLDRTTTAAGITGGVTVEFALTDDLGLRAGGGDQLVIAPNTNGRGDAEIMTVTAYNSGTKTVTVGVAPTNDHVSGARIMNVTRNIRFESSASGTKRGSIWCNYAGTSVEQIFDHCEFRYMGNSATELGPLYCSGDSLYVSFTDCAFHENRYGFYGISGNKYLYETGDRLNYTRCNMGVGDDQFLYLDNWGSANLDDCWFVGDWLVKAVGHRARVTAKDSVFDGMHCLSWPTTGFGVYEYEFTECTFKRIDSTNKPFNTVSLPAPLMYRCFFDNCLMDSSMDTIVRQQEKLPDGVAWVNVLHRNQVEGSNEFLRGNGTIYRETTVTYSGEGASLKFDPSDASNPLRYTFYTPVQGGVQVKAKCYARKDSSYGSSNRPTMKVRGLGLAEATDTMSDVDDTWELIECLITPSRSGHLEVELWTQANAGLAYFDTFHVVAQ